MFAGMFQPFHLIVLLVYGVGLFLVYRVLWYIGSYLGSKLK